MIGGRRKNLWRIVVRSNTESGIRRLKMGAEVREMIRTKRTTSPFSSSSTSASSEGGGRLETIMRTMQERYPGMSASQLPSLTAAFVLLHEVTALVPMIIIFGLVQVTGTGARLVQAIREALPDSSSTSQDPASSQDLSSQDLLSSSQNTHHHPLATSLSAALDDSAQKVSKIAQKYSYDSAEDDVEEEEDEGKSMLDNGVLASGLVAYLAVKLLLPFRVSLSLYLTPSLARQIRRMANYQPKKRGE